MFCLLHIGTHSDMWLGTNLDEQLQLKVKTLPDNILNSKPVLGPPKVIHFSRKSSRAGLVAGAY